MKDNYHVAFPDEFKYKSHYAMMQLYAMMQMIYPLYI